MGASKHCIAYHLPKTDGNLEARLIKALLMLWLSSGRHVRYNAELSGGGAFSAVRLNDWLYIFF